MTTKDLERPFEKLNIEDLGEFIFYHDLCTKSAFVYYPDRGQLDGTIDLTYFIKGLPIDIRASVHKVDSKYINRMYTPAGRPIWIRSADIARKSRLRRYVDKKLYLELLVAINHDTFIATEKNSVLSPGLATVSHILMTYNGADMLYSFLTAANINLNIAGIVIEAVPQRWYFEVYYQEPSGKIFTNATSVNPRINKYFWANQKHFPRHSFDFIMYHTKSTLRGATCITSRISNVLLQSRIVAALAIFSNSNDYMFPPDYHIDRYTVTLRDFTTCKHFTTIAHEVAHLLGVHHDREGPHSELFESSSCELSLMSTMESCSRACLVWSQQTEVEFAFNLRPPFTCNLMNSPRSLNPPGPRYGIPADGQCRCYGFDSHLKPSDDIPENACRRPLICVSKSSYKDVEAPLPMDGTGCGENKVCWNGECIPH